MSKSIGVQWWIYLYNVPQASLEEKVKHLEREKEFWISNEVITFWIFIQVLGMDINFFFFFDR